MSISRRDVLAGTAGIAVGSFAQAAFGPLAARAEPGAEPLHAEFPSHDPDDAREIVSVSHFDVDRVTALVTARPALAKASWDWGFGDWECALGAASHMGRRDIAEVLIRHGARPSIFSAAMLGQLDVVRAFVLADPGVQWIPGPHGITLLSHAGAGGEEARAVVEYLEGLGDADVGPETVQLEARDLERYVGTYGFGDGDPFGVYLDKDGNLRMRRGERAARHLFALGDHAFYPSGAEAVRIQFELAGGKAARLGIHDPDLIVTATRF